MGGFTELLFSAMRSLYMYMRINMSQSRFGLHVYKEGTNEGPYIRCLTNNSAVKNTHNNKTRRE